MTGYNVILPENLPMSTGITVAEGYLVMKDSGNTLTLATTVNSTVVGVVDQTPTDAEATARVTRAGEKCGIYLMGSGAIVNVASLTGNTYTLGCAVYNVQTGSTDGMCETSSANTATKIGHYVGEGEVTASAGQLIKVILDVAQIG